MEWTDDMVARLRVLWEEGHSTAEIGRIMGISKNAVVGKAHRLNLPARPSPIRREPGAPRPRTTRLTRGPTLPPLGALRAPSAPPAPPLPAPDPVAPSCGVADAASALQPSVAVPARPRQPFARTLDCCWPLGEPGTPSFRFCGADAMPGKPYCAKHAQLAYVRIRERRDDAA